MTDLADLLAFPSQQSHQHHFPVGPGCYGLPQTVQIFIHLHHSNIPRALKELLAGSFLSHFALNSASQAASQFTGSQATTTKSIFSFYDHFAAISVLLRAIPRSAFSTD